MLFKAAGPGWKKSTKAMDVGNGCIVQMSSERLVADLAAYMLASEPEVETDFRDVLTGFPPFVDCARRIGADPVAVFRSAAAGRSTGMHKLATEFAGRTDVTLDDWDWLLVEGPGGPCYRLKDEIGEGAFREWYEANIPRDFPRR